MTQTTENQTFYEVFLARVINCFCSLELVVFSFLVCTFPDSKLDYHSRQQGHNLGRLANRSFCPNVGYMRYLNLAFIE